jgi:hypothetical protein
VTTVVFTRHLALDRCHWLEELDVAGSHNQVVVVGHQYESVDSQAMQSGSFGHGIKKGRRLDLAVKPLFPAMRPAVDVVDASLYEET